MAVMRSLNLGQPASIGTPGQRRLDLAMLRRPAAAASPIAPIDEKSISRQTLADILAEGDLTRPTVSGSLLEGLTRGGEAYLRARGGRERAMGEAEQAQTAAAVAASDREREIEMDRARLADILSQTEDRTADNEFRDRNLEWEREWFGQSDATTRRGQDLSAANARRSAAGADAGAYRILSPEEAQQYNLARGTYQQNTRTGQISPVGTTQRNYTEFAGQSAQYANRMAAADATVRELEENTDPVGVWAAMTGGGTEDQRRIRQAQREFVNAILRRESGAVISPEEFQSAAQQYFAQPGDPPEVIEQKRQARQRSIQGLANASQGAYDEWYGAPDEAAPLPPRNRPRSSSPDGRRPGASSMTGAGRVRRYNSATGRIE